MKVIETDNFGSDYPYEKLVIDGLSMETATEVARLINREKGGMNSPRYWEVRPEDYVLNTDGPNGPK